MSIIKRFNLDKINTFTTFNKSTSTKEFIMMNLFLKKIINSGQDGSEQGALAAAFLKNCPTEGSAPKGFRTVHGNKESLKVFNLVEQETEHFPTAVSKNIRESDGTLVYISHADEMTEADRFAIQECNDANKPFMKINISHYNRTGDIVKFIKKHKIETLHITGKADRKDGKLMFDYVKDSIEKFLDEVVSDAKKDQTSETFYKRRVVENSYK